jgi:hypothetical protein
MVFLHKVGEVVATIVIVAIQVDKEEEEEDIDKEVMVGIEMEGIKVGEEIEEIEKDIDTVIEIVQDMEIEIKDMGNPSMEDVSNIIHPEMAR